MRSGAPPSLGLIDGIPAHELLDGLGSLHQSVAVTDSRGRVIWTSHALAQMPNGRPESIDRPLAYLCQGYLEQRNDGEPDPGLIESQVEAILEELQTSGRVCHATVRASADAANASALEVNAFAVDSLGSPCNRADGGQRARLYIAILRQAARRVPINRRRAQSSDFFREILDHHPEATLAIDPAGFITYANASSVGLLRRSRAELLDSPISLYLPSSAILPMIPALDAGAHHDERATVELAHADESGIVVELASRRLERPDGKCVGHVLQLRDSTQQHHIIDHFKQKITALESYVHSVSHDLRSPLASLLGFSRLLKQDYAKRLDETGRRFLDRIEQAVSNMNTMTQDLLEISTREQAEPQKREAVDARNTLLQIQTELKPRLERAGIQLLLPQAPPLIQCDRTQLYQVLSNLIGNAVQHMGPCSAARIDVAIYEQPGQRRIVVRDNGRGIEPDAHDRIFDAFQSLPSSDGSRSTGVGLAIVKKIALAHGGDVSVASHPGQGTTFSVTLEHH